ncbi:uncharacterized protein LOC106704706 [Latimeria chalumnae]|uniref:uncharacterized protein LOC106704706 n=1 Tax=Latimeria chalumnae TaxID=7897 RepID=UPI0006D9168A|nr:PREDICTED: uncharacterized protein LOC106704706 [Latimeria chalumnae]|eukprot:XP_014347789.1 PREDICTED: uncharacterized protein LOC106704706 [Latimeria chalumnae]
MGQRKIITGRRTCSPGLQGLHLKFPNTISTEASTNASGVCMAAVKSALPVPSSKSTSTLFDTALGTMSFSYASQSAAVTTTTPFPSQQPYCTIGAALDQSASQPQYGTLTALPDQSAQPQYGSNISLGAPLGYPFDTSTAGQTTNVMGSPLTFSTLDSTQLQLTVDGIKEGDGAVGISGVPSTNLLTGDIQMSFGSLGGGDDVQCASLGSIDTAEFANLMRGSQGGQKLEVSLGVSRDEAERLATACSGFGSSQSTLINYPDSILKLIDVDIESPQQYGRPHDELSNNNGMTSFMDQLQDDDDHLMSIFNGDDFFREMNLSMNNK